MNSVAHTKSKRKRGVYLSCMPILRLWRKFPPNAMQSWEVSTPWIQPAEGSRVQRFTDNSMTKLTEAQQITAQGSKLKMLWLKTAGCEYIFRFSHLQEKKLYTNKLFILWSDIEDEVVCWNDWSHHRKRQDKVRESCVWGGGVVVRLIDRPDNAAVYWATVLPNPLLIPTSLHPFCQKESPSQCCSSLLRNHNWRLIEDVQELTGWTEPCLSGAVGGDEWDFYQFKKSIERLMDA